MTEEAAAIARAVVERAGPGEEIEAYVVQRRDVDIEVHDEQIESFTSAAVAGIGVRVVRDHRLGFASAGILDADTALEVLATARENAAFGSEDPALGLPDAAVAGMPRSDLDLAAADFSLTDTDTKVDMVLGLARGLRVSDTRVRTVEAGYGDAHVVSTLASSHGLLRRQERTISSLSAYAVVEADGQTQTGFGYDLARDPALLDVEAVRIEATDRALRMLGAVKPDSRRVAVVFDPIVTAQLAAVVSRTLSGEAALKGRSIFAGREGEVIASAAVTFVDDPTDPAAFGAATYDAEGVATRRNEFVRDGVLEGFAHNTWTAAKSGTVSTGNASRASYASTPGVGMRAIGFRPGTDTVAGDLLAHADGGVYVQSVQGMHSGVNTVSGDFSVGVEGLAITGGELGEPFREATIGSTIPRILLEVVAAGSDVRMLSGGPAVPLLVGEMTLGGR